MEPSTNPIYEVSVVTPFHNVDMNMFRRSYESLWEQTIGFANIQWIVVLHNTAKSYQDDVRKLLGEYENVIIKVLDNDAHTPSSPRNYGMGFATAPYIGFLDGDDGYTPRCLQTAVNRMQNAAAQMVVFRREYELEREGLFPLTEIVLWDQTREEIIIDRDNWDDEKMFSGVWGMVTSRLYDRNFLLKYNIAFDETVPFAEDMLFLIEAYGKAARICYLPQFIGYHYFINGGSLVQSVENKPGSVLVSYAKGFRKIFEAAFANGIYADFFMADLLTLFAHAMIGAKNLTLAHRMEIKEILEPYVHKIPLLPVNKLTTEQAAKLRYELPREIILHPENFNKGYHTQNLWNGQDTLLEILQKSKDTDYGRRYHFAAIQSAEGYQARVPLSDFKTYAPLVALQTQIGERGIFTADPVTCYLLSADGQDSPCLLPATAKHLAPYLKIFTKMVRHKTTFLLFESLPKPPAYNDNAVLNSLSGTLLAEFLQQERNTLQKNQAKFTSPEELLFPGEAMDTLYLRLLFALKERDVAQIISPYTWGIAEALNFMEDNWESLCHDIELGEITFALDVSAPFLRRMQGLLEPDRERAAELRRIFRDGFDDTLVKRIWPKLTRIVAFGAAVFRPYTDTMKKFIGDTPHDNGFFLLSTALMGESVAGSDKFRFVEGVHFCEFLPWDAKAGDRPLLLSQTQEGKIYEPIITNQAGLYRYRTGYLIRVEEQCDGNLIFTVLGRKNDVMELASIALTEEEIYGAIRQVADRYALNLADYAYCAAPPDTGEHLIVFFEPRSERHWREIQTRLNDAAIGAALDVKLAEVSPAYRQAREKELPPCRLLWSQPQTQLLYRDLRRFRQQTAPDQMKPTHFLRTPEQIRFFRQNVYD
ncbi:MAG: GH3 auxin-responsive promoter family protein [Selenomonadaceae bacterium]|nr:GH3 auxin-responsive promoter family protein [Selenomonadaceae bacterium]